MSSDSILTRIEQDAKKALIQHAFFRWESALMIGGMILLSIFLNQPFPGWPVWAWPLLGLIGEIAIVVSSLTDKAEQQRVIEALFREKYNAGGIRDRDLRGKLAEAEQYRQRIQSVVAQQRSGVLRDRLSETTAQVYDWIANMVALARRIDTFRSDIIIQRDLKAVPEEIRRLEGRLNLERDARVREQLSATLNSSRQQQQALQELSGRMARADLQLDHSLASLGTVYSQMLLIGSKDVDSDRAEQLQGDIRDQVMALQDIVESLNEVYGGGEGNTTDAAAATIRRQQAGKTTR